MHGTDRVLNVPANVPSECGERLVDFIIQNSLVTVDGGGVLVWAANCHEQLEAFVANLKGAA